jgi:hypothetical protein
MLRKDGFRHGFDETAWQNAKHEAREIMYEIARKRRLISYSDLVSRIQSVRMDAHDARLAHFLGEIATEDDDAGLGLTTVVVVHKHGDQQPGPGFFEMAEAQGRDVSDPEACWMNELNAVYDYWAGR